MGSNTRYNSQSGMNLARIYDVKSQFVRETIVIDDHSSHCALMFLGPYHEYWLIAGFKRAFMTKRSSRIVNLRLPYSPRISGATEDDED